MAFSRTLQNSGLLMLLLLMSSCVKDIDMDQVEEVVLPTEAAVDLVFFNLSTQEFSGAFGRPRATDDVRLEFLDDDYVQTSLVSADLHFRFLNTFTSYFLVTVQLLSPSDEIMYSFQIPVPAGSAEAPEIINYTEFIGDSRIQAVRNSIQMRLVIEMQEPFDVEGGELRLESRGVFKFEFQ